MFAQTLFNDPKSIWEAVSHEVGHSLGLSHDGVNTTANSAEYYAGSGSGCHPHLGAESPAPGRWML